jgi:hypothetical protein
MEREDAAADAITRFEDSGVPARGHEFVSGGEAGDPCADDEDAGRMV